MLVTIVRRARYAPKLPFDDMKNDILGEEYVLSVAFIGEQRAYDLNLRHRGATYVPNVLSFPLDKKAGEIFITPQVAKRQAPKYHLSVRGYIGYLFIHGLLHLKGHRHGDTMDAAEAHYMKKYALS